MYIGVDYGSKMAGTTVVTYVDDTGSIRQLSSEKKKDADAFLLNSIDKLGATHVFIDAPLSLPAAYYEKGDNYFYRQCDIDLKAMSPMFLGGLTARAIKLTKSLNHINFFETYPKALKTEWNLDETYKTKLEHIPKIVSQILEILPFRIDQKLPSWHAVDSLLAFGSGYRYQHQMHKEYGIAQEGLIIV